MTLRWRGYVDGLVEMLIANVVFAIYSSWRRQDTYYAALFFGMTLSIGGLMALFIWLDSKGAK